MISTTRILVLACGALLTLSLFRLHVWQFGDTKPLRSSEKADIIPINASVNIAWLEESNRTPAALSTSADYSPGYQASPTPSSLATETPEATNESSLGLKDIVVLLKTGSTEIYEKLPIHLATTFASGVDYVVYSDLEQQLGVIGVKDALKSLTNESRDTHPDLDWYRRLQQHVSGGGVAADLRGDASWVLDKWKNGPAASDSYHLYGREKKWYVFIDADTSLSMHNLVLLLQRLDHTDSIYMGSQAMIGDTEFAHGGSGYVLSSRTAERFANLWSRRQSQLEVMAADECCGDMLVAKILREMRPPIALLKAFPMIQGETPTSLDWSKWHWCRPAVTWHHVDLSAIDKIWQFEQDWARKKGSDVPILFRDFYDAFIDPRIRAADGRIEGWDNLSNDWVYRKDEVDEWTFESVEACEKWCGEQEEECLQWTWAPGLCRGSRAVRLGWAVKNRPVMGSADDYVAKLDVDGDATVVSGWMLEKIKRFREALEPCDEAATWLTEYGE